MADQIKKLSAGHSIEVLDAIMTEVEEARGEHDNLGERLDEMSSGTPAPSTAAPAMDGTAAAGTSTDYARADHIHPSDTSKQDALTTSQLAAANSGIDSAKVEQIETNKNNISLLTAKANQIGLKLVKSQAVASNTEVTYTMNKNDFIETSPDISGSIGTYIISVMPWSTTPNFSLYSVSYTGGSFSYTSIVKIAGADRTVTVSSGIISVSGFPSAGAKVSIHAML